MIIALSIFVIVGVIYLSALALLVEKLMMRLGGKKYLANNLEVNITATWMKKHYSPKRQVL